MQDVRVEEITTCLPVYKLYDLNDRRELDISHFLSENKESAFKKLLVRDDDLELWEEEIPGSTMVRFRVFDTPGLDDTNGNDVKNIAKTFSALFEAKEFHLVLIMDSHHVPLLNSQERAFKSYFELFEELKGLITIVHTKVPDIHRHPRNMTVESKLSERSVFFNEIMGREVPSKRIDCDLAETGPVHLCLRRNTIREILEIATIKTPAIMSRTYVHKALVMVPVDRMVHARCMSKLDEVIKSCEELDKPQQIALEIQETKDRIKEKERLVSQHDNDDLLQLYEKRFDEEWTVFGWVRDHTIEFPAQECTISKKSVIQQSIKMKCENGGEGFKWWEVRFKRTPFQIGYYHVVLSTTRRDKHHKDIEQWKSELGDLRDKLNLQVKEDENQRAIATLTSKNLKMMRSAYRNITEHTSAKMLTLDVFKELAEAGIYQESDPGRSADALQHHLEKNFGQGPITSNMASIRDLCNPEPEENLHYHHQGGSMLPHPPRQYPEHNEFSKPNPPQAGGHLNHHPHDRLPQHHPQHYQPYPHRYQHQSKSDKEHYSHLPPPSELAHFRPPHNEQPPYECGYPYVSQFPPGGPSHSHDHYPREHINSNNRQTSTEEPASIASVGGDGGNTQYHLTKPEHVQQDTTRRNAARPDERPTRIKIVQQPLHARMCGFGEKDRRPIDPPPIVQLLLDEDHEHHPSKRVQRSSLKKTSSSSTSSANNSGKSKRKSRSSDHGHDADDDSHADNEEDESYQHDDGEDENVNAQGRSSHSAEKRTGARTARGRAAPSKQEPDNSNLTDGSESSPSLGKRDRTSGRLNSGKVKRSGSADGDGGHSHSDHSNSESDTEDQDGDDHHSDGQLQQQDPLFVLHVSLWSADGKEVRNMIATPAQSDPPKLTRILMGSLVVSPVLLNNVEGVPGWYFSFPDLSIRTEGVYTLKFSLMRFGSFDFANSDDGHASMIVAEEVSEPFTVFSAKKFPGMTESTELSKAFAKQGLKIPIRNDLRVRKADRE
ncbi:hypothetical protein BGZ65_009858 [Modicella reniformis]|uniref:Velvet domain-containing protein n=1 Tax=Modicella reniformis TaxID=1440133 RepID=A0A9P6IMX2_9FUNG|nr:hypothetical protein BGZ65_009858 [Modicella reniformis]